MNEELLEKLLEYIDARIAEKLAYDTVDGGLVESVRCSNIKTELRVLLSGRGL